MKNANMLEQAVHWTAFTYVAALYLTIVSVQSYTMYVDKLLG